MLKLLKKPPEMSDGFEILSVFPEGYVTLKDGFDQVREHVKSVYRNNVIQLDTKLTIQKVKHPTHKLFGDKVFVYRRNSGTDWFIVYNIDNNNNIFIPKIISNYLIID